MWAHYPTTRNIPNTLRNLRLAMRELRRRRPDVIVSDGAGVAFPFFVVGRLLGIPTVYLEVYDRIDSPTLTGRLCRPLELAVPGAVGGAEAVLSRVAVDRPMF